MVERVVEVVMVAVVLLVMLMIGIGLGRASRVVPGKTLDPARFRN